MQVLEHLAVGKTKEKALEEFFRFHEKYNGNRRKSPREFIKVRRVRRSGPGSWRIYYTVPARVLS